jgi:Xaa-Pro aminopeptidase
MKTLMRLLFLIFVIQQFLTFNFSVFAQETEDNTPKDFLSATFHKGRREAVRANMPPNSVAVFFANPVRNRSNDTDFHYHQNTDFYYLTGYNEPNSMLLIFSENQKDSKGGTYNELIFAQPRDPRMEMWNGKRLGKEGVKNKLGFQNVYQNFEFADFGIDFKKFNKVLFLEFFDDARDDKGDDADLFDLVKNFKTKANVPTDYDATKYKLYELIRTSPIENSANVAQVIGRYVNYYTYLGSEKVFIDFVEAKTNEDRKKIKENITNSNLDGYTLEEAMNFLREVKFEEEIKLLRKAISISCIAQREVMKALTPDMSEMEIQGIHEFVYRKYGSEYEGYPSIVGAGNNGCVLHYIENNRLQVGDKQLVLMDVGAEYHGYTADVTRTVPANGKFTEEQKAIYNLVYQAQEEAIKLCKAGVPFNAPHAKAQEIINEGLVKLGVVKAGESHNYFPHGTSHYLGLDVHDRGTYQALQANSVITVEPGIYIPKGSPCDPKWWGIAVRIEDDILITPTGYENLSALAPRKWDEIEALMKEKSPLNDLKLPTIDK